MRSGTITRLFAAVVLAGLCGAASANMPGTFQPLVGSCSGASRIILTTGTSFVVPACWNNANNSIETIGGGGGSTRGPGGGGGGYSKATNQTLPAAGSTVTYQIGQGGAAVATGTANNGTATYFCNSTSNCATIGGTAVISGANPGLGDVDLGLTGGAGGTTTGAIGSTKFAGGNGAPRSSGAGQFAGGGGGGAAGTTAAGNAGLAATQNGPGGNGGRGNGVVGGLGGTGSIANGGAGGAGQVGTEIDGVNGSGGGGGGAGAGTGGAGGSGGAGGQWGAGAGGASQGATTDGSGAGGKQGFIVITFTN